ncbi:hypothetical protein DFJ63DRAFT_336540 [Scheffersomyces coipomensis]|uniref:uncharacterized protein n=1 Tax=Scheffersomyces coipomensis TaxID=1788519 RepID=UPI00315D8045
MNFKSDKFTYKAYTYTSSTSGVKLGDISIKLEKQSDGSYNVPADKVLIKVHAAALNLFDVKLYNLAVWPIHYFTGKRGLGEDYSGKIVAIGSKVKSAGKFKVGDLVQGFFVGFVPNGTFSEYILVDTSVKTEGEFTHVVKNLSLTDACSWPEVYGTVNRITAGLDLKDKKILVLGGGSSIGRYLIQYLKLEGAREIYATASSRSAALAKELGAKGTIDYTKGSILNPVLELVHKSEPFDIILDCVGGNELFPKITDILPKSGGHYNTVVGDSTATKLSISKIRLHLGSVRRAKSSDNNKLPYSYKFLLGHFEPGWIERGKQLIEEGKLKPFIDRYYKFSELEKGLAYLEAGKVSGKIILKVEED